MRERTGKGKRGREGKGGGGKGKGAEVGREGGKPPTFITKFTPMVTSVQVVDQTRCTILESLQWLEC